MSVHYKFKSALDYDTVTFDGLHISVGELKSAISQQKRIGKTSDFDLQITNAQTKEVYIDDQTLIPKNTSLLVARVPLAQQPKKQWHGDNATARRQDASHSGAADLSRMEGSEQDKIDAMISQSTLDYDPSNYQKIRGQNQAGPVPQNYRCHRCHKPGHWIKNCPLGNAQGGESVEIRRSTGIPLSFMVPVAGPKAPGAMMTPSGDFAVPAVDHEAYQASETGDAPGARPPEEKRPVPEDLVCSLCGDLLTDAVMIPCCGNSFCDECIRNALLDSPDSECPDCREKEIAPTTLIPNRFLRNSVSSFRNQTGYSRTAPHRAPPPRPPPPAQAVEAPPHRPPHNGQPPPQMPPTRGEGADESDASGDDNITVTVPPREPHRRHERPERRDRERYDRTERNERGVRPHHPHRPYGGPDRLPDGPPHMPPQMSRVMEEQRSSTPTVDESRDPIHAQMVYGRPPGPFPPIVPPPGVFVGGPPGPPGVPPGPGFYGRDRFADSYQPPPPGIKLSPINPEEDPLEAFNRMIREKEERAKRRETERRRLLSPSPPPPARRSRSPAPRLRSPPQRFSRSRSTSRGRRRSPQWSPRRRRTRDRSLSLSRSPSPRRRRSPPRFRSPLRSPLRSPPRSPLRSPLTLRSPPPPRRSRSPLLPRHVVRTPPPHDRHAPRFGGGFEDRSSPPRRADPFAARFGARSNGPGYALLPAPMDGPPRPSPPYRRYDDIPPGAEPPVPGYEPPPFDNPAAFEPPPQNYGYHPPDFRPGNPPSDFRPGNPPSDFRQGNPPSDFRPGNLPPDFREPPFRAEFRDNGPFRPPPYRDAFRDGPPPSDAPPRERAPYRPGRPRPPRRHDDRERPHRERDRERYERERDERKPRDYEREERATPDRKRRTPDERTPPRRSHKRRSVERAAGEHDIKRERHDDRDKSEDTRAKEKEAKKLKEKEKKKKKKEKDAERDKEREKKKKKDKHKKEKDESREEEKGTAETAPAAVAPKTEEKLVEKTQNGKTQAEEAPAEEPKPEVNLYDDVAVGEIDDKIVASYGKDSEPKEVAGKEEESDPKEDKESSFEGLELAAPVDDPDLVTDEPEVLAPLPEPSKWEVEDEPADRREPGELSPETERGAKVTSDVIKRAENAIFTKAIGSIKTIEIKKISGERAKLYSDERKEGPANNIQITVPVAEHRENVSEKKRKRSRSPPPPKLSVKARLGGKVDERSLHSTVERMDRSRTPKREQPYRRVTVDQRSRRVVAESGERDERRLDKRVKEEKPKKKEHKKKREGDGKDKEKEPQPPARERKRSTIDEASFEPDYDEHLTDNEVKDERKAEKAALIEELLKKPPAPKIEDESSSSSSSESSSSSDEERRRKKKRKRDKKKKKKKKGGSDSESDSDDSSDHKKKKKHKKKSSKKKKKKSKHK